MKLLWLFLRWFLRLSRPDNLHLYTLSQAHPRLPRLYFSTLSYLNFTSLLFPVRISRLVSGPRLIEVVIKLLHAHFAKFFVHKQSGKSPKEWSAPDEPATEVEVSLSKHSAKEAEGCRKKSTREEHECCWDGFVRRVGKFCHVGEDYWKGRDHGKTVKKEICTEKSLGQVCCRQGQKKEGYQKGS